MNNVSKITRFSLTVTMLVVMLATCLGQASTPNSPLFGE